MPDGGLPLGGGSHLAVALVAVYGSTLSGLEGYFRLLTTLGAYHRVHLPRSPISASPSPVPISLLLSSGTARGTTPGLVGKALGCVKLLFTCCKGEFRSAIGANERLIFEGHRMTSFLRSIGSSTVIQCPSGERKQTANRITYLRATKRHCTRHSQGWQGVHALCQLYGYAALPDRCLK